jgi:hypothetical protein
MLLATWFHGDTAELRGEYAQMIGDSTSPRHWNIYQDCVDLVLASARRWNPGLRLAVVLNPAAAEALTGERRRRWTEAGATVLVAENTHRVPAGFHGLWQNQFFVLDCLRALSDQVTSDESVVLLDSDCLVTRSLDDLDEVILTHGRAFYPVPFPEDAVVNGLSRIDLTALAGAWHQGAAAAEVDYLGGEFFGFRGDLLKADLDQLDEAFAWALRRADRGLLHPNEEAQLMSMALAPALTGDQLVTRAVRRIWTQPWQLRNACAADRDLALWHLPAEKRTGLRRVHRAYMRPGSWFWTWPQDRWLEKAGRLVGVPAYRSSKAFSDAWALAPRAVPGLRRRLALRGPVYG